MGKLIKMAKQRTFSIIKPDATIANNTGGINQLIEGAGLKIIAQRRIHLTRVQAERFYAVHSERPFFSELIDSQNLNPKDIILWELFTDNKDNSYTFSHDYKKIFKNTNYKLVYIYKHTNNITYLYHFKNNDF